MENNILRLTTKISQLQFLRELNFTLGKTFPKTEKKIKKNYFDKYILNKCLAYNTKKTKQCMNSRKCGKSFCYKHLESTNMYYESEYTYLFDKINVINMTNSSHFEKKDFLDSFEIMSKDEYQEYTETYLKTTYKDFLQMLVKEETSDDIKQKMQDIFLEKFGISLHTPRPRSDSETGESALNKDKCHARISSGRQCINNRWNESGVFLDYCNLHKRKMPHGDFRVPYVKKIVEEPKLLKSLERYLNLSGTFVLDYETNSFVDNVRCIPIEVT